MAQSSSEIPEGLMNNPVFRDAAASNLSMHCNRHNVTFGGSNTAHTVIKRTSYIQISMSSCAQTLTRNVPKLIHLPKAL
jgi:hypothetical protein